MLAKDDIIKATITDSLGQPAINTLIDYPDYSAEIKNPAVLRGITVAELRVLDIDERHQKIRVSLHGYETLNPKVSTARAIYISYFTMRNTVAHILRSLFKFR